MSFVNCMKSTLGDQFNYSETENGALGYRTTQNYLLDLNFATSSLRNEEPTEVVNQFMKAYHQDKILALKWLLMVRDVREGSGERRTFRIILKHLADYQPEIVVQLLPYLSEYGRYDDLIELLGTKVEDNLIQYIRTTLNQDFVNMNNGKSISLLAKWLPSVNSKSQETRSKALVICDRLKLSERKYRKILTSFRNYLKVVETYMCSNKWDQIDYESVPSQSNLRYSNAFLRHDETRRLEYLNSLVKGEAKINASTIFPHDIVHRYSNGNDRVVLGYDETVESLWKALPDTVPRDEFRLLVIRDGSYSMTTTISNTNVSALDVSTALAIYTSERIQGEFHNKFITFSAMPSLIELNEYDSLRDKLDQVYREDDCSNTDIESVFDLILQTAIDNSLSQEEIPSSLLIISDMEFDGCDFNWNERLFTTISKKYEDHGYQLPRLVFWNVCSRSKTIPIIHNPNGLTLVSGFSPNSLKMVLSNELDPWKNLLDTLNNERYAIIDSLRF